MKYLGDFKKKQRKENKIPSSSSYLKQHFPLFCKYLQLKETYLVEC